MGEDLRGGPVRDDDGPLFRVQVSSEAVRSWVSLRGELDVVSAPHLQEVLDQLCRDGALEIVLDLSGLEFVSAAGLTVFHRVADHLRAAGGQLILHRPRWLARRALSITGLDTVLTIRPAGERRLDCDHFRGRRAVLTNRVGG
jgi:anti-sigma B factor antagonist